MTNSALDGRGSLGRMGRAIGHLSPQVRKVAALVGITKVQLHALTTLLGAPSVVVEQATSSYSFRSPELSQPI
jgi:hypothetical protein